MKIAIAIWKEYVSNVCDFADGILIVDFDKDTESERLEIQIETESFSRQISQLKALDVDVLICGAISRSLAEMVTASGIELLAYITGSVNEVIEAYISGKLDQPQFTMPGCWPGARKGLGRCKRCCRHRHRGVGKENDNNKKAIK